MIHIYAENISSSIFKKNLCTDAVSIPLSALLLLPQRENPLSKPSAVMTELTSSRVGNKLYWHSTDKTLHAKNTIGANTSSRNALSQGIIISYSRVYTPLISSQSSGLAAITPKEPPWAELDAALTPHWAEACFALSLSVITPMMTKNWDLGIFFKLL